MNARFLQLRADGLTLVPKSELIAGWKAGDQPYWVDGLGVSDDWVKEVLADAEVAPIIENAIFTRPRMSTSMSAGKSIYFRLPVIVEHRDHLDFFHALWSDQLLVTWRANETKQTERFIHGLNAPSDAPWVTNMADLVASSCALLSIDANSFANESTRCPTTSTKPDQYVTISPPPTTNSTPSTKPPVPTPRCSQ